jgi:S-adenosylmethionine/arginine decarboxylase-like enzyme
VESLGYGTQLIVDGFSAEAEPLADALPVEACLREVANMLESSQSEPLTMDSATGMSATLRLSESHVSLHTFTHLATLSLAIFSRHELRPSDMTELLGKYFGVRRVESYLSSHSRTMPQDEAAARRVLAGDRAYSALRLDSSY